MKIKTSFFIFFKLVDEIFLRIKETYIKNKENKKNDTEFHNLNLPASKGIQDNIIDIRTKHILTGAGVLLTVKVVLSSLQSPTALERIRGQ